MRTTYVGREGRGFCWCQGHSTWDGDLLSSTGISTFHELFYNGWFQINNYNKYIEIIL